MYPAQAFVNGLYTYEDLPDVVVIDIGGGETIQYFKLDPPEIFEGGGAYYIDEFDADKILLFPDIEESVWTYEGGGGPCLVNGYNGEGGEREDQFADTYTVTYLAQSISVTVSRISLCAWKGNDGCGRPWYLIYSSDVIFGAGVEFRWNIWMAIDESDPCEEFQQRPQQKNSDEFDNTPIGNYTEGDYPATVS